MPDPLGFPEFPPFDGGGSTRVDSLVSRAELWFVGGRVEFYPSLFETLLLEILLVGLTWAFLGLRKCYTSRS